MKKDLFLQLFNLGNVYVLFLFVPLLRKTRKVVDRVECYKTQSKLNMVKRNNIHRRKTAEKLTMLDR